MGELFATYNILGAFGLTILLTVSSAVGSLVIGTVVAIMRVDVYKRQRLPRRRS